jgi:glucose/arabinose dehydrogenase
LENVSWKRYAAGLFQALGLKIVDNQVYVLGRDQITRLHDLNNDGEADFYENFNNDMQVTPGFHEFAFDLQTDPDGNFYFSKGGPVNPGGSGWDRSAITTDASSRFQRTDKSSRYSRLECARQTEWELARTAK